MPQVCRFWQQGTCRNGDNCRFLHPGNNGPSNTNRFSALQSQDTSNNRRNNGYDNSAPAKSAPYLLDKSQIVTDLSSEKPQWTLSAYGPGKQAPAQLFGGEIREQSFEEMRLNYYRSRDLGNEQQAIQEEIKLFQASEQQIQIALNDIDGAIRFIISAENEHPNRIDKCKIGQVGSVGSQPNPFTSQTTTSTSTFGAPSQPVHTSAFGAPSAPSAFGQPSSLGQKPNPFGNPTPAFGAPSALGATGTFGQPSALGQKPNAFGASSFDTLSQLGPIGAFGQPSAVGQTPNPFGAPSGVGNSNPQTTSFPPFSSPANPFSQQTPTPASNPFSQPPAPFAAQTQSQTNPFSQSAAQPNPFSSPQPTVQPNPFSAPSTRKNPFGVGSQPQPPSSFNGTSEQNPFGAATVGSSSFNNPIGNATAVNRNPRNGFQHPPLESYASKDGSGRLRMFKGKQVEYNKGEAGVVNDKDQNWVKIWFPEGPPPYYKDTELEDGAYDENTKSAYMSMRQTGVFPNGVMPLLPPKHEWCTWDF